MDNSLNISLGMSSRGKITSIVPVDIDACGIPKNSDVVLS